MSRQRLEAFSDAVMAVAITLLALDLKVDRTDGVPLSTQLREQWPAFAAFAVSFFIIGCIWISHHALFRLATGVDQAVLIYNILLLLFVTAIPFTTSTYADYVQKGGADARAAVIAYGAVMTGMSISFTLILQRLLRTELFSVALTSEQARKLLFRYGLGVIVYPVITVIGMINAPLMLLLYIPVIAYYFGPGALVLESESPSP